MLTLLEETFEMSLLKPFPSKAEIEGQSNIATVDLFI
jgi:hypothetical protein